MDITKYIKKLNEQFTSGSATEHTYRPTLQTLLEHLLPGVLVTNEPKRIECGAPDYVLTRNQIPLGYIETKGIDKYLDDKAYKEQLNRYIKALDNLILTDYLKFRLYRYGEVVSESTIAKISNGRIERLTKNFEEFNDLIKTFGDYEGQIVISANDLARRMAHKARMMAKVVSNALLSEDNMSSEIRQADNRLQSQLAVFRKYLMQDIKIAEFAGIYAQTVTYGMFAARLHDLTPDTFSRQEAADLIPATNPFLRKFFQHIAGYDLDTRILWIVDDLADLFRATDVGELMRDFGKSTQRNDPFLHFYETFLGEYDPKLRKSRGVYYTPEPVVDFIVRAVDDVLCSEFGMPKGLADTGKTVIEVDAQSDKKGKPIKRKKEIHKVQILDPATGTGTFLATIFKYVHERYFAKQQGAWPDYVKNNLIPRLNGFEIMMASYTMAHTKLEMVLRDSGCESGNDRLRIFLTNSLEEHDTDIGTLLADWLSAEAKEADHIKRNTPVMVVIGNPPYSGESANKGTWIVDLLQDYKKEPGGDKLQEKNPKWINDDYVKFIRYGQHYIDRTGTGVLAYINNHSYLDNPTFRGMRWSLLQSFDKIYILDLHGNTKKKETAPDGSADENVFDIQQGVSINLFVKTGEQKKNMPARVFHYDLYGVRESKYQFLWENNLNQISFKELDQQAPQYFFVPKDYGLLEEYETGFSVNELFPANSVGIVTARDSFTIYYTPQELRTAIAEFRTMDDETAREKYGLGKDMKDWKINLARQDLEENMFGNDNDNPMAISYRPFDTRYTYYTGNSRGFHCRPRGEIMRHFLKSENIGLVFKRGGIEEKAAPVFLTKYISESRSWSRPGMQGIETSAPLYIYPNTDAGQQDITDDGKPNLNLNQDIIKSIASRLGLHFTTEKEDNKEAFSPIDLLDYIYAVLHSPKYRERYKEFLKIDFPRVPYPTDKKNFHKLVTLGGELRALHLMESPALDNFITGYPQTGDHIITKPKYKVTDPKNRLGSVYINPTQHFTEVPETAWNFYIGGYQPAQKWLKDRKGRTLTSDDIRHYQQIIVALSETGRLMKKIDTVFNLQNNSD